MILRLLLFCSLLALPLHAQDCTNLPFEVQLAHDVNHWGGSGFHSASGVVSDALLPLTIGVPVMLVAYGALEMQIFEGAEGYRHKYAFQSGLEIASSLVAAYGTVFIAKKIFGRARPYQEHPDCITNYRDDAYGSFPSGHSAGSAALATSLSLAYPEWYVIAPSVAYALYTGFSRMHLGMHYLSDVVGGYAVGVGAAVVVHLLRNHFFPYEGEGMATNTQQNFPRLAVLNPYQPVFAVTIPF
ncbi:MAG: phosphatase PAP2 family protein [Ignavibacteria bacterium]|nr:phosphatase PAP2 family protein [Ignavibacteria bacterium]